MRHFITPSCKKVTVPAGPIHYTCRRWVILVGDGWYSVESVDTRRGWTGCGDTHEKSSDPKHRTAEHHVRRDGDGSRHVRAGLQGAASGSNRHLERLLRRLQRRHRGEPRPHERYDGTT